MDFNFRGKYDSTQTYIQKDIVTYQPTTNDPIKFYFCLSANSSTSPQSPSSVNDNVYWGIMNTLSNFPNSVDVFNQKANLQASDKADINRIGVLSLQTTLTPSEQDELNTLINKQRNKLVLADDINALQSSIQNMQFFFQENVQGYINTMQSSVTTTVNNGTTSIQSAKDDALSAIEVKKENVITYMDSTTAGALRNDLGVMGDLTTTDKTSLVNAINEVNAKDVDLTPINNKIGDLTTLETTAKDNLVHAVNEVKEGLNNINLTASNVSITDSGGYFNATNTENALQEIGSTLNTTRGSLITSANSLLGS